MLEAVAYRLQQPFARERFLDEVVDAQTHRFERLRHGGLARDDDSWRKAFLVAQPPDEIDAVITREPDVDQQEVGKILLQRHQLSGCFG